MKSLRMIVWACVLGFSAGTACAQPGGGRGPGAGPGPMGAGPVASAPGMGPGMGPGGGRGGARWGADHTPGWALMTQQERDAHRDRMRSMKTYDECKTYQEQHHAQMAARAQERGGKPLPQPRQDACSGLKR